MERRRRHPLRPTRLAAVAGVVAAATVAALPAAAGAAVRTAVARSGPFALDGFQTRFPTVRVRAPGVDGWLTHMDARLVDARGRPVTIRRVMLHHVVFFDDGPPGAVRRGSCDGHRGEPFYGTGEERQRLILPSGFGYRLGHRDRWRMQTMLMSHSTRPMRVFVEWRMRIATGVRLTPVTPFWLRANGCRGASYTVPGGRAPGSTDRRSWTWRVPFDGRIVAAGGHLHGGAKDLVLSDPSCHRRLLDTRPTYAPPGDLVYAVRPILHEPGPVGTGWFSSQTGLPVRAGQRLRVTGLYDDEHPRARVMSILHVYVARSDAGPRARCPPLPHDRRELLLRHDGHPDPPYVPVPFNVLGDDGRIRPVAHLPGAATVFGATATVDLRGDRFVPAKVAIPAGGAIRWRFRDPEAHNVLYAGGPAVVGSPTRRRGATTARFSQPGTYELFCVLHPITMHQEVVVG